MYSTLPKTGESTFLDSFRARREAAVGWGINSGALEGGGVQLPNKKTMGCERPAALLCDGEMWFTCFKKTRAFLGHFCRISGNALGFPAIVAKPEKTCQK